MPLRIEICSLCIKVKICSMHLRVEICSMHLRIKFCSMLISREVCSVHLWVEICVVHIRLNTCSARFRIEICSVHIRINICSVRLRMNACSVHLRLKIGGVHLRTEVCGVHLRINICRGHLRINNCSAHLAFAILAAIDAVYCGCGSFPCAELARSQLLMASGDISPFPARPGLAEACFLLGIWGLRAAGPRRAEGRDGAAAGQALRLPGARGGADLRRLHVLLRRQRDRSGFGRFKAKSVVIWSGLGDAQGMP